MGRGDYIACEGASWRGEWDQSIRVPVNNASISPDFPSYEDDARAMEQVIRQSRSLFSLTGHQQRRDRGLAG
jgi:hypothetical protein